MSRLKAMSTGALLIALTSTVVSDDSDLVATDNSVMQLMETIIAPASDTLWSVDDPETDEAWQMLDDAAMMLIDAFEKMRLGGTGPNDAEWAKQKKFQAYIDADIAAVMAARAAITARDLEGLFEANDALYSPCEACHIDFNPAVRRVEN